jgi:flagellar biosynthesis chaperone FliJ
MADGEETAEGPDEQSAASPERARHWAAFYQELISYEERILESMRELSAGMSAGQMEAVRKTNLEPLEELIDDFRRRLALWRRRIDAEEAKAADGTQSEPFRQSPPNTPTV